jgi:phage terminase large subunit-like protein
MSVAEEILKDPELADQLARSSVDLAYFSKLFFSERFSSPFSRLHYQIFDLLNSGAQRVCIAAPRGLGKTSMVGLSLAAQRMLFRLSNFIVYVSNSATSAMMQTENLKMELVSNPTVRRLFGPIKANKADLEGLDESFSRAAWATAMGTLILPRGSGQQVRGVLYKNSRPDLIIVDDLEDTETITNPEIRLKRKEWFHGDLEKCISRYDKNWRIIYIDTLKHEDALLQELLDSSEWESVILEICGDDYKSKAPEFMSDADIMKEVLYHREKGMMDVFFREYRNIPVSKENATFRQEYFKYYNEDELQDKYLETIVIIDPAKTVQVHSAESAVIGISLDPKAGKIYIRDVVHDKLYPDQILNAGFDMIKRLRAIALGVEVTSLNEFILQPIKNEMVKRRAVFNLVELKARAKKEDRIAALVPYYRQGYIYHNKTACTALESQLLSFPRSRLLDIMDAEAYMIEMLELGERYFEPDDSEPEVELDEDEAYQRLEDEQPLQGWRIA